MDVTISAGFSGRPYDLRMRIYTIENNVGANYSRYRGDRYAYSRSGYGSYANNAFACESWIGGYYAGGSYSLPFAPGDYAGKTIGLGSYDTGGIGHDGNGYLNFSSRIRMLNASVFGSADTGDVGMSGDRLPRPPAAPSNIGVDQVTTVSLRYRFSGNGDGGSPITSWQAQIATDPGFTQNVQTIVANDGNAVFGSLTPGTMHYMRSRGNNAYWNGPWSATASQTTLPAVAPGMSVTPSPSGTSAVVALTPPGGSTGVTKYTVEYRIGTAAPTVVESPSSPILVAGLTPGTTYEWRASAWFGTYQSPLSAYVPVVQPNPNTSPGDFFDGATADKPDVDYQWTGTVNNSTSIAVGQSVSGWAAVLGAGAVALLQRVVGGYAGSYSARLIFTSDATAAGSGVRTASDGAAVAEGGTYFGSIYVRPSRSQRLRAELHWFNSGGVEIGTGTLGAATVVTDTTGWTRLNVSGPAPAGAVTAQIRVIDVTGTGWSLWLSGDQMLADAAMVSLASLFDYFDGSTPDTTAFQYEWEGAPNNSISARYEVAVSAVDPLADPDCPPLPIPPAPPTITSECIDETGTWRRYTLTIPSTEVRLWSASLPTLILRTGASAERQVRVRYYGNPDGAAAGEVTAGDWESEQILTYIPPITEVRLDGVTQRATAAVGGAAPVSANRLLFGTGGIPATWPELRCGIGYVVTLDVPLEAPPGNLEAGVLITQRM